MRGGVWGETAMEYGRDGVLGAVRGGWAVIERMEVGEASGVVGIGEL